MTEYAETITSLLEERFLTSLFATEDGLLAEADYFKNHGFSVRLIHLSSRYPRRDLFMLCYKNDDLNLNTVYSLAIEGSGH